MQSCVRLTMVRCTCQLLVIARVFIIVEQAGVVLLWINQLTKIQVCVTS